VSTIDRAIRGLVGRAAAIGADPRDDEATRFRKALLVVIAILVLPIETWYLVGRRADSAKVSTDSSAAA
jgi:hypothetical protein